MGGGGFAVIADELEAANHLANGEETQALGGNNAGGDKLRAAHVPNLC